MEIDTNPGENSVYEYIYAMLGAKPETAPPVSRVRLDVGDIHISHNDFHLFLERKQLLDLSASICDGRFREQKSRMLPAPNTRYAYVIEGAIPSWDGAAARGIPPKNMWGALVKTAMRDNLTIFHTASARDTASLCIYLHKQLTEGAIRFDANTTNTVTPDNNPDEPNTNPSSSSSSHVIPGTVHKRKRDNLATPSAILRAMLADIPGISVAKAETLLRAFPDVPSLMRATESEIASVKCGERKIGPKQASVVKSVFPMNAAQGD